MTGRLQESATQSNESASDTFDEIASLDAYEFNGLVMWLPKEYRNVYLAYVFNKAVIDGRVKTTKAGDVRHQSQLLGITRYRYDQVLDLAIKMIKRQGGLA